MEIDLTSAVGYLFYHNLLGGSQKTIIYTSIRCTPMRYTPMRCTPVRFTPVTYIPTRCTL
jgi:hypothetical protein